MKKVYVRLYILCVTLILGLMVTYMVMRTSKQDKTIEVLQKKIELLEDTKFNLDYEFKTK